ncbi:MAG: D-amino acid aminotransferase [Alphaproteobacteria bacterium RIFOXYD12_FULL_60_8]|nr:MAG: D-amino acid aminotransferase [Alphaproteobacteria bacterium RIFOXYD12_FULL_60_8]
MFRAAYVNGFYVSHQEASVHIDDRGYQFADGVYEVVALMDGRPVDAEPHLDRLDRSLREMDIPWPVSRRCLNVIINEVARRNRVRHGMIYIQITRGVAPRDHAYDSRNLVPSLVVTAKSIGSKEALAKAGVSVISHPDIRWGRCDIKTTSLLPNIMAKQQAKLQGAFEAWLVDAQGYVTEGSAANAWIITKDGEIRTHALGNDVLAGITRQGVLKLCAQEKLKLVEKPFKVEDVLKAEEAFLTSATNLVLPVVRIDGKPIGSGAPGPLTVRLRAIYLEAAKHGGAA